MKKISIFMMVLGALLMMPVASAQAGLVALWHLDGNANDSSVNDNHGTVDGATYVASMFDEALDFDGSDDCVVVADDASLTPTGNAVTLEAWIKPASIPGGLMMVAGKWNDGDREYEIMIHNGKVYFFIVDGSGYESVASSTTLSADTWYHVAGVYDGADIHVYVDGSLEASKPFSGTILDTAAMLTIGGQHWNAIWQRHFDGIIDEVRIWDEALTASDIEASFKLASVEITKKLIGLTPFIDEDPEDGFPDLNDDGYPMVPMAEVIEFDMEVTVTNNSGSTLTNVKVKDPLPAELELVVYPPEEGCVNNVEVSTKGKSEKVFIEWDLGYVTDSSPCTLEIEAKTDINPGGGNKVVHQEYTSPGIYDLNAGATLSFCVEIAGQEICLDVTSNALEIQAVELE